MVAKVYIVTACLQPMRIHVRKGLSWQCHMAVAVIHSSLWNVFVTPVNTYMDIVELPGVLPFVFSTSAAKFLLLLKLPCVDRKHTVSTKHGTPVSVLLTQCLPSEQQVWIGCHLCTYSLLQGVNARETTAAAVADPLICVSEFVPVLRGGKLVPSMFSTHGAFRCTCPENMAAQRPVPLVQRGSGQYLI